MAIKVSGTTVISDSRALENITDIPNIIKSSFIESPTNGSTDTDVGKFFTVDVSPFQAVFGVAQTLTIQLDNNSDFSSPFYNVETVTSGSEVTIDASQYSFPTSTTVYVRARYKDADGNYSAWTPTISFTSRVSYDYIITPSITAPSNGATDVNYQSFSFGTSAFQVSGGSWTHDSTDWQIATDSNFTALVLNVVADTTNKVSRTPPTLDPSTTYYFRVRHKNDTLGYSDWSNTVSATMGDPQGEVLYTTPGSYTWTAPAGVTAVSVVAIGAGGSGRSDTYSDGSGGAAGGLGWKNSIPVIPGNNYTVQVGANGGNNNSGSAASGTDSYFLNTGTVKGGGGTGGRENYTVSPTDAGAERDVIGGNYNGDGGGNGGWSYKGSGHQCAGGGTGGYTGNGGVPSSNYTGWNGIQPQGGGGGGGCSTNWGNMNGGGGVGLFGQGASGQTTAANSTTSAATGGSGGLSGYSGTDRAFFDVRNASTKYGQYGAGGHTMMSGANGAVRIIWGSGRSFPSNAS
jgi:hypothetical protein